MAGSAERLGIYGFGAAGHIVAKSRAGRAGRFMPSREPVTRGAGFARRLGAVWAGASGQLPDTPLDAASSTPRRGMVPAALRAVRKGGRVVWRRHHMSDIPSFPYDILWEERQLVSVANLTRQDGLDFLKIVLRLASDETTAFPCKGQRGPTS